MYKVEDKQAVEKKWNNEVWGYSFLYCMLRWMNHLCELTPYMVAM